MGIDASDAAGRVMDANGGVDVLPTVGTCGGKDGMGWVVAVVSALENAC